MTTAYASHHHQLADDRQRDYLTRADRARWSRRLKRQGQTLKRNSTTSPSATS